MGKAIQCLRCKHKMEHVKREKLQLGRQGWILGDLPNLIAGAMEVDIFACPDCGKIEFFLPNEEGNAEKLPQKQCPECGKWHDFDYPKCPFCKHNYDEA